MRTLHYHATKHMVWFLVSRRRREARTEHAGSNKITNGWKGLRKQTVLLLRIGLNIPGG